VAETEEDMQALLVGAAAMNSERLSFLPVRQGKLFRWRLSEDFRSVLPMTLMAIGEYQDPGDCYMSSILY
jgi:hypothetical protein